MVGMQLPGAFCLALVFAAYHGFHAACPTCTLALQAAATAAVQQALQVEKEALCVEKESLAAGLQEAREQVGRGDRRALRVEQHSAVCSLCWAGLSHAGRALIALWLAAVIKFPPCFPAAARRCRIGAGGGRCAGALLQPQGWAVALSSSAAVCVLSLPASAAPDGGLPAFHVYRLLPICWC